MIAASIFPEGSSDAFWIIIAGLGAMSALGFVQYACGVKRWLTHTRLDTYFERRRGKLVDAYLGGDGNAMEQVALFTQLPSAIGFGLWFMGTFLLKFGGSGREWLGWTAVLFWVAGSVFAFVVWRRSRFGPPDRAKPQWLLEEEKKREEAGEIMRYQGGWVRKKAS